MKLHYRGLSHMDPTKAWSQLLKGDGLDTVIEQVKLIQSNEHRLTLKPFDLDRLIGSLLPRLEGLVFEQLLDLAIERLQRVHHGSVEASMRRLSLVCSSHLIPVNAKIPAAIVLNLYLQQLKLKTDLIFDEQGGWFPWLSLSSSEKLKYCRQLLKIVKLKAFEDEERLWQCLKKALSEAEFEEIVEMAPSRFAPFDRCPTFDSKLFQFGAFQGNPLARLLLGMEITTAHRLFTPIPPNLYNGLERAVLKAEVDWLPEYLVQNGLAEMALKWLHLRAKSQIPCIVLPNLTDKGRSYCQAIASIATQREEWPIAAHYWEQVQQWERAACCYRHAGEEVKVAYCLEQAIIQQPTVELLHRAMKAKVQLTSQDLSEGSAVWILQREPSLLRTHPVYLKYARFCLGEAFEYSDVMAKLHFFKPTPPDRFFVPVFELAENAEPESLATWLQQLEARLSCLEHHCTLAYLHRWSLDWPAAKQEFKVARTLADTWGYKRARQAIDDFLNWEESFGVETDEGGFELTEFPEVEANVDWDAGMTEDLERHLPEMTWKQVLKLQSLPFYRRRILRGLEVADTSVENAVLICWLAGRLYIYNPEFKLRLSMPFALSALQTGFKEIMSDNRASLSMGKRCQGDATVKRQWWEGRRALEAKMGSWLKELEIAVGPLVTAFCFPGARHEERRKRLNEVTTSQNVLEWLLTLPAVPKASLLDQLASLLLPIQLRSQAIKQLRMALICTDDEMENVFSTTSPLRQLESVFSTPTPLRQLGLGRHLHWIPWEQLWPDVALERIIYSGCGVAREKLDLNWTYLLNPSGDLMHTQEMFLERMSRYRGIVGRRPSGEEMLDLITSGNPFIYFGHSAGEQFMTVNLCSSLQSTLLLMGCRSMSLDAGLNGPSMVYLLAQSPTLVGCLWDVTDRDLDRFTERLLDGHHDWASLIRESRPACVMKLMNGASTVIYRSA